MSVIDTPTGDKRSGKRDLPRPSSQASEHSAQVLQYIRDQIRQHDGRISFESFMQAALYAPGLGYYRCGSEKFGAGGDFITAPEISPLFAKCLAASIASTGLQQSCLEFGAGSGKLAVVILQELEQLNKLPEQYLILELSEELRHRQQQTLQAALPKEIYSPVHWLDALPDDFTGVVIANEVLDAMPVRRFLIKDQKISEQYVTERDGIFYYDYLLSADGRLTDRVNNLIEACQLDADGDYLSEINFMAEDLIKSLGEKLQSAIVLLIDYGYPRNAYYHVQRRQGTLMCHYQHRAHPDPLILPGIQDITAHIDFTAMADAALEVEMDVLGFTTQGHFLLENGLLANLEQTQPMTADYVVSANEVKRLTLPGEMGEHFKVLALGKQTDATICGFQSHDMRHLL